MIAVMLLCGWVLFEVVLGFALPERINFSPWTFFFRPLTSLLVIITALLVIICLLNDRLNDRKGTENHKFP